MMKQLWPALLLAGCAGAAQAQATRMMMPEDTYDLVFGVAMQRTFFSAREGGDNYNVVPALEVQWSNGVFVDVNVREAALGVFWSDNPMLNYGALAVVSERDQRADTPGRRGGVALQAGGFVNWHVEQHIDIRGQLLAGGGFERGGLLGHLELRLSKSLAAHHHATLSGGLFAADHSWQQGHYGVSPAQAAGGAKPVYRAGAGVVSYYRDLAWQWQIGNKYSLTSGVRLSRLGSGPAASPLVAARNRTSVRTSLSYHF
jgi:outer membrane protein